MLRGSGTRPASKQSDLRARSAGSDLYISEALAVSDELFANCGVCDGDDVGGEVTGILAVADADRGHRDSRGHLHDGVQSIDTIKRAARAGESNHRKNCVPCEHARKGCSEACDTDETITITDANGTTTTTVSDGVTGWTEGTLVDGSNTLTDADSLYSATGMGGASITVGSGWATGHTARVGITFADSSTFSYPSGWVCVGDDCSGGDFTFSQGSSYWLFIEKRPDATWMTCQKVPS